ncbi:unnamed protein product [Chrysoparadoxa australica]
MLVRQAEEDAVAEVKGFLRTLEGKLELQHEIDKTISKRKALRLRLKALSGDAIAMQEERLRHTFHQFDADCSGAIDGEELGRLLTALHINAGDADLKVLQLQMDCDGGGDVSFQEFLHWWEVGGGKERAGGAARKAQEYVKQLLGSSAKKDAMGAMIIAARVKARGEVKDVLQPIGGGQHAGVQGGACVSTPMIHQLNGEGGKGELTAGGADSLLVESDARADTPQTSQSYGMNLVKGAIDGLDRLNPTQCDAAEGGGSAGFTGGDTGAIAGDATAASVSEAKQSEASGTPPSDSAAREMRGEENSAKVPEDGVDDARIVKVGSTGEGDVESHHRVSEATTGVGNDSADVQGDDALGAAQEGDDAADDDKLCHDNMAVTPAKGSSGSVRAVGSGPGHTATGTNLPQEVKASGADQEEVLTNVEAEAEVEAVASAVSPARLSLLCRAEAEAEADVVAFLRSRGGQRELIRRKRELKHVWKSIRDLARSLSSNDDIVRALMRFMWGQHVGVEMQVGHVSPDGVEPPEMKYLANRLEQWLGVRGSPCLASALMGPRGLKLALGHLDTSTTCRIGFEDFFACWKSLKPDIAARVKQACARHPMMWWLLKPNFTSFAKEGMLAEARAFERAEIGRQFAVEDGLEWIIKEQQTEVDDDGCPLTALDRMKLTGPGAAKLQRALAQGEKLSEAEFIEANSTQAGREKVKATRQEVKTGRELRSSNMLGWRSLERELERAWLLTAGAEEGIVDRMEVPYLLALTGIPQSYLASRGVLEAGDRPTLLQRMRQGLRSTVREATKRMRKRRYSLKRKALGKMRGLVKRCRDVLRRPGAAVVPALEHGAEKQEEEENEENEESEEETQEEEVILIDTSLLDDVWELDGLVYDEVKQLYETVCKRSARAHKLLRLLRRLRALLLPSVLSIRQEAKHLMRSRARQRGRRAALDKLQEGEDVDI